ncbi:DeoR/GlpR family DNA-binding transcription regulator [Actinorugispora endophytica]|uniref:DeoR family transcriptional regulator n=1 Tax=Actinorugispora endophytica TaxID=1605990 RepID=A0A4R6UGD6_9ACTN|nr:DeoR/GlpR family DNA-binding transcription regulator [Actinorugispora endophytica]TDQ45871.1 DeoR family transcriptional regulator [Actinorugispora endophytica]
MAGEDKPVFAARRRERILELVRANGAMALRDIADQVRVSEVTVRRDVRTLEAEGLIDRRRGGAALPGHPLAGKGRRAGGTAPELSAIARKAAPLVSDDDAIVLGPGEAVEALAAELTGRRGLTVVTNSLRVAQTLAAAPGVEVVMTGGTLRGSVLALVGGAAEQSLEGLRVRRAFVSGQGVTAERGLSTPNAAVAGVDRALAACAEEVIVLADHSRVGADTMVQTVAPEHIAHLVTDSHADPEVLMTLEDMGTTVYVAVPDVDRGE